MVGTKFVCFRRQPPSVADVINDYEVNNFLDVIAVVEKLAVCWLVVWRVYVLYRKCSYQDLEVKPHSPIERVAALFRHVNSTSIG